MDAFRDFALNILWPICILLWTILAGIGIIETVVTHRHAIKKLTQQMDKLEKQIKRDR